MFSRKEFVSFNDFQDFIKVYQEENKVVLRTSKSWRLRSKDNVEETKFVIKRATFVCAKFGDKHQWQTSSSHNRKRSSYKSKCCFEFRLNYKKSTGKLLITEKNLEHNHELDNEFYVANINKYVHKQPHTPSRKDANQKATVKPKSPICGCKCHARQTKHRTGHKSHQVPQQLQTSISQSLSFINSSISDDRPIQHRPQPVTSSPNKTTQNRLDRQSKTGDFL